LCFHGAQASTKRRRERRRKDFLYWWTPADSSDKGIYKIWKPNSLDTFMTGGAFHLQAQKKDDLLYFEVHRRK